MKTLELETAEVKDLAELLFRGLAYTDEHYRSSTRMRRIYNNIISQLKKQGGNPGINGSISFKK